MLGTHRPILMPVLLAFDYGEKRIGVAIGNTITGAARALTTLKHSTVDERFAKVHTVIKQWEPAQLVVGLPCHPDGTAHEMTALCKRFADQLKGRFGLPVTLVDERFTSAVAAQEGAPDVDAAAAALILQAYFNEHINAPKH
jgi:putative holliday junction resolvase